MTTAPEPVFAPSIAAAARAAGLSRGCVASWVALGLVRRTAKGIDLGELRRVMLEREHARQRRPGSEAEHWLAMVRMRRAETLALGNERRAARLVDHRWVEEQHRNRTVQIERDLAHLAERLAPELVRLGVPGVGRSRVGEELANLVKHYGRPLPAPPPPPGPEVDDMHDDHEDADLLPHDDVRDDYPKEP